MIKKKTKKSPKIEACQHGHVNYDRLERLCNLQQEYIKQRDQGALMVREYNERISFNNKILHDRINVQDDQIKTMEADLTLCVRELQNCYKHLTTCKNPMHDEFLDEKVRLNLEKMKPKH